MGRYKYLLWDIDGTVLDFLAAEKAAIKTLFKRFNFGECTDEMVARYSKINVRYWQALERGEMTKPQILLGRFREFFAAEGMDPDRAEEFNSAYQLALGDTVVFCDDAKTILEEEKSNGYILAAITNGTKIAQTKKLANSGLELIFDKVFISEELGFEKPDRRFFETVIEELNIGDLGQALIIGDSLTSDIKGASLMGIDSCWYNPKAKENTSDLRPDFEIADLHELEKII